MSNTAFTVATAGDLAGALHFRVAADENFDPDRELEYIKSFPSLQQPIIMLIDDGADDSLIEVFAINAKKQLSALLVFVTTRAYVRKIWHAFDRTIVQTLVGGYTGVPANELHFIVDPTTDDYPVVAPLGAQQTHIYVMAEHGQYNNLLEWARQAPYTVGVIRNPL